MTASSRIPDLIRAPAKIRLPSAAVETERLILRAFRRDDLDSLAATLGYIEFGAIYGERSTAGFACAAVPGGGQWH